MEDVYNFQPNSEEESVFIETYSSLSKTISKLIRSLPQEVRLKELKLANPTDVSLCSTYLWAIKQEDYETCEVVKELLSERGHKIPNE